MLYAHRAKRNFLLLAWDLSQVHFIITLDPSLRRNLNRNKKYEFKIELYVLLFYIALRAKRGIRKQLHPQSFLACNLVQIKCLSNQVLGDFNVKRCYFQKPIAAKVPSCLQPNLTQVNNFLTQPWSEKQKEFPHMTLDRY